MSRRVSIRLTRSELLLLDRFAADNGVTRSEVIRNAVAAKLEGRI